MKAKAIPEKIIAIIHFALIVYFLLLDGDTRHPTAYLLYIVVLSLIATTILANALSFIFKGTAKQIKSIILENNKTKVRENVIDSLNILD